MNILPEISSTIKAVLLVSPCKYSSQYKDTWWHKQQVIYIHCHVLSDLCGMQSQPRAVRVACDSSDLFKTQRMPPRATTALSPARCLRTPRTPQPALFRCPCRSNGRCLSPHCGISDMPALLAGWLHDLCFYIYICNYFCLNIYRKKDATMR